MHENEDNFSLKQYFTPLTNVKAIHFIIILGFIVFLNGLFNNFIGDDFEQIINNPYVHSLNNIFIFFSGSTFYNGNSQGLIGSFYRPIMTVFYAVIYTLFGP